MGTKNAQRVKLTDALSKEICGYIEAGDTFGRAYLKAGIGEKTFYKWKAQGLKDLEVGLDTDCARFVQSIKNAEEGFKSTLIGRIKKASLESRHWTAAAWLLERKYPNEYGRKIETDGQSVIVIAPKKPVTVKKKVAEKK